MSLENENLAIMEPSTVDTEIITATLLEQPVKVVDGPASQTSQETDNEDSTKEIKIGLAKKLIDSTVSLLDKETQSCRNYVKVTTTSSEAQRV